MPLETHIALISTINDRNLTHDVLDTEGFKWHAPPPTLLTPFKYRRRRCSGPASGYQIALKYDGLICRIDVTVWGISYRKSTPNKHDMEVIQISKSSPYHLEIIFI